MEVSIVGFKAIRQAKFDIAGVTILGGLNEAGKSSTLTAIGAALARQPIVGGITKEKEAASLVLDGEDLASVMLSGSGGSVRLRWPSCEVVEEGTTPPSATVMAAGLRRFMVQKPEDRARLLITMLGAMPTKEDLTEALKHVTNSEKGISVIWDGIEQSGWDAVLKGRLETGTKIKGAWQQITGENWGSARAKSWEPKGWLDELRMVKEESELRHVLEETRQKYEAALRLSAVKADEMERLSELAGQVENLDAQVKEASKAITDAEAKVTEARGAIGQLKALIEPTQPCPHCAKPVKVSAEGVIVKPDKPMSDEQAAENKARLTQWEAALTKRLQAAEAAKVTHTERKNLWIEATAAAGRLKNIREAGGEEGATAEQVEAARAEKEKAQTNLDMWMRWNDAHTQYRRWATNQELCDILAPEGLRKKKLDEGLKRLNARLEQISTVFQQPPVSVTEDMDMMMGGRRYGLMSESAQWRAALTLQIALGEEEKAPLIVADRADVLNRFWKERVIGGLVRLKVNCLIAMAANGPELLPELSGVGGRTYWVEGGTVLSRAEAIGSKKAAA